MTAAAFVSLIVPVVCTFLCRLTVPQLRLVQTISSIPVEFGIAVTIFINQQFSLLCAVVVGTSSIVPLIVLFYRPKLVKLGVLSSILFSVAGIGCTLFYLCGDVSVLIRVPITSLVVCTGYIPHSMALLFTLLSYNRLLKESTHIKSS